MRGRACVGECGGRGCPGGRPRANRDGPGLADGVCAPTAACHPAAAPPRPPSDVGMVRVHVLTRGWWGGSVAARRKPRPDQSAGTSLEPLQRAADRALPPGAAASLTCIGVVGGPVRPLLGRAGAGAAWARAGAPFCQGSRHFDFFGSWRGRRGAVLCLPPCPRPAARRHSPLLHEAPRLVATGGVVGGGRRVWNWKLGGRDAALSAGRRGATVTGRSRRRGRLVLLSLSSPDRLDLTLPPPTPPHPTHPQTTSTSWTPPRRPASTSPTRAARARAPRARARWCPARSTSRTSPSWTTTR